MKLPALTNWSVAGYDFRMESAERVRDLLAILRDLEKRAGTLIASSRGRPIADKLERAIGRLHRGANNVNFDFDRNGERRVIELIASLSPQMIFDVGANRGEWSGIVSRACPNTSIHAFEIVPDTFRILKDRLAASPRVTAVNIGLSDEDGAIQIHLGDHDDVATAHPLAGTEAHRQYYRRAIDCRVERGDRYIRDNSIDAIDLLKIDVEGMDLKVIRGFGEAIRNVRAVQFEYGIFNISSHDLLYDFYRHLSSHGFVVGKIFPRTVIFSDFSFEMENFHGSNYIAVRETDLEIRRMLEG